MYTRHANCVWSCALTVKQANNVRGQWQRAFSSTTLTLSGSIGGIAGSLIFRSQDKPEYVPGLIACLTYVPSIFVPRVRAVTDLVM